MNAEKLVERYKKDIERFQKMPFFTSKEEVVDYVIKLIQDELEEAKEKKKTLPKVIEALEKLKGENNATR